jgi:amino acid adenylation domain-containing protein
MLAKKFEDQVERTPGNIAVKTPGKTYTYSQLNRYANEIAALISGAAAGDTVGLFFDHGVHMIAAILGALKAGKTYVPLPVYYPENRLSYMLSDSESALLVTGTAHAAEAARLAQKVNIPVLTIETDSIEPAAPGKNLQNPVRDISADSTAYILYTSGSTGRPKGVLQTLRNTDYFTRHWIRVFSITSADRMTLIPSFCHDASVQDIFSALHTGAALFPFHLRSRESTMDLSEFLKKEKITIWHSVSSLYSYFVNTLTGRETFPELRWIVLGGELVRQREVEMFNRFFPHSTLAVIYGQTESSINSIHVIQQGETFGKPLLGTPLDEIEMLVIDDEGEPVGPLQSGEILIGCPYISPGYQGNPELTSAVFAQDEEFGRLYWTGDLGRLLVDGSIEFLGRRDHQVKIRGFRVELEEIETCLLQHPGIQEAVVTLREDREGDKYLCAYTVCAESAGEAINARQLRAFLSQELPDYMIPASFVTLERMPRTPNGKIDRKALPEPEIKERDELIAPSSEIEKKLAGIWAEVLGIKKESIGVEANFFELGGHSLKAARLTLEIHKTFDVNVPLAEIFKSSTIRELAAYIKKAKKDIYEEIQPLEKRDYYPQSSAQKRLFFLDKFEDIGVSYNMTALFKIEGKSDKKRYENTFAALIARHESLRTSFYLLDNEPVQIVHDHVDFEIEFYAARKTGHNLEMKNIIEQFIRPFDLARAPLLRVGIVEISAQASLLLFDMHHIISDGASIGILAENFARIYNGEEKVLPEIQYKDYTGWQDGLYKTGKIRRQEEFWLNRYPDSLTIPRLNLPTDFPRPGVFSYEGSTYRFTLGAEDTLRLIQMDAVCEATLYMKLLALFNVLLYKYTGQEDIIIGSGIEGRHHAAVKPLIGLFVNMLAMRNCPEGGKTFQEFLEEIKVSSINAFENQDVQFEALIEQLALERDISRNPLFDAALFLQNFARPDIDIGMTGIRLSACKFENKTSKFDMTLYAWEKGEKIAFRLEYYTKLFKIETIERLAGHFINVIRQVCRKPEIRLSHIDIITEEEKQHIISGFNNTNVPFPAEKTVHRLIEEQVDKNPHHTAAVMANNGSMRNEALTYKELNEQANRLARLLRDKGIDRDSTAAVLCERSLEMLIGILGVLKAGGAYIPVDINFPIERITTILAESGTRLVLTISASFEDMPEGLYKFSMDTRVSTVIYLDNRMGLERENNLFRTLSFATSISSGTVFPTKGALESLKGMDFCYREQTLTYDDVMTAVEQLRMFMIKNRIDFIEPVGIMIKNPVYKIIALLTLKMRGQNTRYDIVDPDLSKEEKKRLIAGASVRIIFSECRYLDGLDRLMRETETLDTLVMLDSYTAYKAPKEEHSRSVWNYVAEESSEAINDFGWVSGYNREKFSIAEMEEYRDNVKMKLSPYLFENTRVMELGCGHGIVMYEIAREVGDYLGTDISDVAIKKNKERIRREGIHNIDLMTLSAGDISKIESKTFDIIIGASVVQYFPNTLYLEDVIKQSLELLEDEGIIFLSDIPDLAKKQTLIESTAEYKKANPGAMVRSDWEEELFLDKDFFYDLQQKYPEVVDLEISKKLGEIENELTRFRYDVLLKVNKRAASPDQKPDITRVTAGEGVNTCQENRPSLKKRIYTINDIRRCASEIAVAENNSSVPGLPMRIQKSDSQDRYPGLEMSEVLDRGTIHTYSKENLKEFNQANDLCYVAYTSGSSGNPKGVMIEHRNVVNFIEGMASKIDFSPRKVILCVTTISFDIFVLETLLPLVKRLRMIMADAVQQRDPDLMEDLIIKHHVGILQLTPSRLKLWAGQRDIRFLMEIEALIVGGEVFPVHLYESLRNKYQGNIYNVYGPTETTVWSTLKDLKGLEKMNIGGPIANTRIYILDESDGMQPIGIEGELCIGGEGVARGYLNNPELTAEKFDPDFQKDQEKNGKKLVNGTCKNSLSSLPLYPSTSLYRTGDRARWLANGDIEFAGRVDLQVKIRGYRIELGEISGRLSKHDDVKEAAVIAKEDEEGDNYLCAYIVPLPGKEPDILGLKAYLAQELPAYMIPSVVVSIDRIPLTASGKLDGKSLPEPRGGSTSERYAAPRDEIEKTLVGIWSEVLLLNKETVSMNDHFFESGGHSLKAAALTAKIHETFQVKMPLAEIFKRPVLSGISEYIKEAGAENHRSIEPVEEKEYYPLSSAQKRLYVLYLMEKESVGYNLPAIMELEGDLDTRWMETVFKGLIERHESLRTSFEILNGELVQKVQKRHECRLFAIERPANPGGVPVNPDMGLRHCRFYHSFIRPFDLSCAPLLRVGLIKIEEKHHLLILDMHHIISDGISMGILRREFMALYAALALPPLRLQYKDYSDWHNKEKDQNAVRIREKYWLEQFTGDIPRLHLPYDFPRSIVKSSAGSQEDFEITGRELEVLKKQALENEATLFMVLLAIFIVFLSRISREEEIVVGTPTAGRKHVNVENIVGIFINTLALRNTILPTSRETFRTVVREVRRRTLEAFDNQDYPFEDLVEQVVETRDTSRSPLFDVMFVMQNMDRVDIRLPGITLRPYPFLHPMTAFDLVLIAGETPGKLVFTLRYCTGLFKRETILRLIRYFKTLLRVLSSSPDIPLTDVDIIDKQEKQQILYAFNVIEVEYPKNKTLHQLFEEQVERTPDNIAAIDTGEWTMSHLTYGELEKKSNRLAGVLIKKGVTLNSIVGLMVGPSTEMVIGILGILKAGGAYLPIDPDYPIERKLYMLKESSTVILVSEGSEAVEEVEVVELDKIKKESEYLPTHPLPYSATQLCYVIYTSGTTGRPKGVLVEHKGVINYIYWRLRTYGFSGNDVTLQLLSYTFDGFVANFYPPLLSGGKLILVPASKRMEFGYIRNKIKCLGVTNTSLVPAMYELLVDNVHPGEMSSLRFVVLAGETLGEQLMEKSKAKNPGVQHIIEYGPTEATVTAAANTAPDTCRTAVVGTPIANNRIYLWDNCKKLAGVGVPGELCIAGDGVARGYLNHPELTAEKFDQDFHHSSLIIHHSSLYRTGDLARWLPDGNVEFLGRIDHQVKIRGFRVEPGEIVNRLVQHEDIKEAVVIDREDENKNKYLCAYIVPNSVGAFEKTSNTAELRNYLSSKLPAYMIPAHFFKIDRIPVTTSGKIDLKALQRIEGESVETGVVYAAPRNETEKKIRATWMEILGLEKIGIHDNFFELGGNSLDIVKLSSRLREVLAEEIPVVILFQYPTVHSLAHYLNRQKTDESHVDKEAEEEKLDISEELLFDAIQLLEEG